MSGAAPLMAGKRGVVLGVANDHSIAWGIARTLAAHGAAVALTYQNEAFERRVRPLAEKIGAPLVLPCDVASDAEIEALFEAVAKEWPSIDFLVHSLAWSGREELSGRYADTSRANFARTLDISCYSFTAVARRAAALMPDGGSMLTLTYSGAERVMPYYNVMGVAKAALEASVRYLAIDLGPQGVRVNALSAGPMRTLAGSAIGGARETFRWTERHSPLRRNVTLDELGGAALYLLSDLAHAVTGEVHHADSGYNIISVPGLPEDDGPGP